MILTVIVTMAAFAAFGLSVKKWLHSVSEARGSAMHGAPPISGASPTTTVGRTDTEFSAEVVRISSVSPHPNADRLELIRFEMKGLGETSYEVVSQKGTFQVGDLAAYFSVDCILPLSHPDFAFLGERLDGKVKGGTPKTHYRLKAARLRGVFSQGLLTRAPVSRDGRSISASTGNATKFGDQLGELYGVTYHVDNFQEKRPANLGPGVKAPAVQPIPVYGVDSLKKNPRLFEEGEEVLVTEKIHGTNFRFGWIRRRILGLPIGWRWVVGSHRTIRTDGKSGPTFYDGDIWTQAAERMGLKEKAGRSKGYVFYGELYGKTYTGQPIQDLTYGAEEPKLAIFDVRKDGQWLHPAVRFMVLQDANLDEVPQLAIEKYSADVIQQRANGPSTITAGQIREGVVVEALVGPRKKAKYVGSDYLMRKGA